MGRAVEQIEQEISALDQTVAAFAQAFQDAYRQYLTALSQATGQQLILAGYHICTHGYPEQFLKLSLTQRQELQQSLQRLAKQGQIELLECLKPITPADAVESRSLRVRPSLKVALNLGKGLDEASFPLEELQTQSENAPADFLESPFAESPTMAAASEENDTFSVSPLEGGETPLEANSEQTETPALDANLLGTNQVDSVSDSSDASLQSGSTPPSDQLDLSEPSTSPASTQLDPTSSSDQPDSSATQAERPLYPSDIAHWQTRLEDSITEVLQNLSHSANRVLQQADILPNRLPEPVLEVAAKADLSSETVSPPNLLNLLIESDEEEGRSSMTQIIAIRLRLSEIEFGDAASAAYRSKLRHRMNQLTKLGREYQRKQKECAIARAEAAWRSSWFEAEG